MQKNKCKNLTLLVFKFQEKFVKLNFASKKCGTYKISETGFLTLEFSYGSAGIGLSHNLEYVVRGLILAMTCTHLIIWV